MINVQNLIQCEKLYNTIGQLLIVQTSKTVLITVKFRWKKAANNTIQGRKCFYNLHLFLKLISYSAKSAKRGISEF